MRSRRGAAVLAAISAVLLAVSVGYFSLTPGAFQSLASGGWVSSLLQTTADDPDSPRGEDAGSAESSAEKGKKNEAKDAGKGEKHGRAEVKGSDASLDAKDASSATDAGAAKDGGALSNDGLGSSVGSSDGGAGSDDAPSAPQEPAPAPANTVTVTVSVSSSAVGGPVASSGTFTFDKGATAYDALCALGLSVNASSTSMGVYVSAIGGLAEKEHGATSGWMYSVNGVQPNQSAGGYVLSDGDSVSWYYVTG